MASLAEPRRFIRLLVLSILFCCLGFTASAQTAQPPALQALVTATDLRSFQSGANLSGTNPQGQGFSYDLRSDGSFSVSSVSTGGYPIFDNGHWSISGNQLCLTHYHWKNGEPVCVVLAKGADGKIHAYKDNRTYSIVPTHPGQK